MSDAVPPPRWGGLTPHALDALLSAFDADRERAGAKYAACHERLRRFFEWRGCERSDDLADDTLDRVAQKLGQGVKIERDDPLHYVFGVARLVCLEALKSQRRARGGLEEYARLPAAEDTDQAGARELDDRVRRCLESLPADQRSLIIRYFQGDGRERSEARQQLALQLGVPMNALRIRIHRIRERMAECVRGHEAEPR